MANTNRNTLKKTAINIPAATTIPLEPMEGVDFYAVVIPEQGQQHKNNCLWIFKRGGELAICQSMQSADFPSPTLTIDGIRTRDIMGEFDGVKEELLEMR